MRSLVCEQKCKGNDPIQLNYVYIDAETAETLHPTQAWCEIGITKKKKRRAKQ